MRTAGKLVTQRREEKDMNTNTTMTGQGLRQAAKSGPETSIKSAKTKPVRPVLRLAVRNTRTVGCRCVPSSSPPEGIRPQSAMRFQLSHDKGRAVILAMSSPFSK